MEWWDRLLWIIVGGVIMLAIALLRSWLTKCLQKRWEDVPEDELQVLSYVASEKGQQTGGLREYLETRMHFNPHRARVTIEKLTALGEIEETEPPLLASPPWHRITDKGKATLERRRRRRVKRQTKDSGERP